MKNKDKIVGLLSEMLHKFDVLTDEVTGVKEEVTGVKREVMDLNKRVSKVENEIVKLNLISAENSRSLMKPADNNDRIIRLEKVVFK